MKKNHATAARTDPETDISIDEALPVGAEASGPSLAGPSSADDEGDMSGVGDGGDEAEGESDELVGPSALSPELESGLDAGVLVDDDVGGFALAPPPEDGEALGVVVEFFLALVGAEALGGEVGAEAVDFCGDAAVDFGDAAAAGDFGGDAGGDFGGDAGVDFGDAAAAGEGDVELLSPLALGAPAGFGGSAAKTAVMAKAATARDRSLRVIIEGEKDIKAKKKSYFGEMKEELFRDSSRVRIHSRPGQFRRMSQSTVDVPPKGGFSFDLCKRNDMLIQKGLKAPSFLKTGTTIVGLIFKDGVILGADTRATEGPIVADKNCEKIHYMAPNIYCCGAGTAADTEAVTDMVSSQLRLHRYQTGRDSRVITALTLLKKHLFSYQGHVSAALVLGGVDITGPHLHTIYPHGSTDTLPFATMGSGSLAAMSVFEAKYKEGLTRDEGIKLVAEAICSGIFNDLGSGSNVDICVITKGNKEYLRNYMEPNPRTYVSSKGYSFTKKTEVLRTKITPLMERVEITEVTGEAMEE
ncbi:BnaA06g32120D [Brassica napus]|uniref:proteasome endopeptidase complex n=1 Tax=Brassica napus TaxID=3708 RepID=A0A078FKN6_BRANA|nr:BnaA06g32120D [Brassica napus]